MENLTFITKYHCLNSKKEKQFIYTVINVENINKIILILYCLMYNCILISSWSVNISKVMSNRSKVIKEFKLGFKKLSHLSHSFFVWKKNKGAISS